MELEQYCDNLATELSGWRARFDEVVSKFDKTATGDKFSVVPQINDLHMIMEEFEERIGRLRSACHTDWDPAKFEFGGRFKGFKPMYGDISQDVSPGDIGG